MVVLAQVLGSLGRRVCVWIPTRGRTGTCAYEDIHPKQVKVSFLAKVVYGDAAIRAHAPRARLCVRQHHLYCRKEGRFLGRRPVTWAVNPRVN